VRVRQINPVLPLDHLRRERLLVYADLFEHAELIPVVPALNDLSIHNASDRDPSTEHGPAARGEPQSISRVRHDAGPSQDNFVIRTKDVLDRDLDIGERAANFPHEFRELLRPANSRFRAPLSPGYPVCRKQLIHRLDSALIPYFLKPASHQLNVFVGCQTDGYERMTRSVGREWYMPLVGLMQEDSFSKQYS
jgi:hypothetical protein